MSRVVFYLVSHVAPCSSHRLFSGCSGTVHCMTLRPVFHAQAKKKKKEEAANAKLLEAEKRIKVSLDENLFSFFKNKNYMVLY